MCKNGKTLKEGEVAVPLSLLAEWERQLESVEKSKEIINDPLVREAMGQVTFIRDLVQEILLKA